MALLSDLLDRDRTNLLAQRVMGLMSAIAPTAPSGPSVGASVAAEPTGDLTTFRGLTLDPAALQSLIDIARESDVLPGLRELNQIGSTYRSYQQQADLYANRAGRSVPVAPPGQSLHQQGLAIDAGWWSAHPELRRLLQQYGWYWGQAFGDYPHWSYGTLG